MFLRVDRIDETFNSTLGRFFINGKPKCYTLEDDSDPVKVQGETRIPPGLYEVELRYEGGFYDRYSDRFHENHPMLWLRNVPDYEFILIHILNFVKQTDGCIGPGTSFGFDEKGDYFLKKSEKAYKKIYYPIRNAIESGEKVTILISDYIAIKPTKRNIPGDRKLRNAIRLKNIKVTVSALEKMWFDLDGTAVIMGTVNFATARLTGYKWFRQRIKAKNDQSILGRLLELINIFLTKMRGKAK